MHSQPQNRSSWSLVSSDLRIDSCCNHNLGDGLVLNMMINKATCLDHSSLSLPLAIISLRSLCSSIQATKLLGNMVGPYKHHNSNNQYNHYKHGGPLQTSHLLYDNQYNWNAGLKKVRHRRLYCCDNTNKEWTRKTKMVKKVLPAPWRMLQNRSGKSTWTFISFLKGNSRIIIG